MCIESDHIGKFVIAFVDEFEYCEDVIPLFFRKNRNGKIELVAIFLQFLDIFLKYSKILRLLKVKNFLQLFMIFLYSFTKY